MEKCDVYQFLVTVQDRLSRELGSRKSEIVADVRDNTPKGGEAEGHFMKRRLEKRLRECFGDEKGHLVIEGVESHGVTQFKHPFFGNKPAPDFVFNDPRRFALVGEVKYGRISLRAFATGIGQAISYMQSSKRESTCYEYGYLLFFNTAGGYKLSPQEQDFQRRLWDQHNLFVQVL